MPDKTVTFIDVGLALLIVVVGFLAITVICKLLRKALMKSKLDEALHTFFVNCLKVFLWIIVLITAMSYIGIPVSAFLAALGAAGVAIALALKDSLANFAGGILIILTKPFSKGDFIEDYETSGKVDKIDLLYTTLKTFDNKIITIPNGKLANSTIVNYSRADNRRVDCNFSIGYDDDIAKAKEILLVVAESNPDIFDDPAPLIGVSGHGQNSVTIDLKVWCKNSDYWDIKYYLEEQVKLAFDEAGITIPYPQLDVHIKK
ncbi:mechanosensitive ion channel family protein [Sinanaerobacter chloroacetimidivorans]|jgi:small conductance mechanosensitive channel|uniref:Mechanosensitive ion channel family protein n=1 Tax=Sinanaerobacter chloroacetimidivorans TaxID=2818044 RepID=A0A8J8B201_9FIRM|nr:mechanosensitive ion channel family protein [Sinanaerobacter chloroacetimidivorans]MBR0598779.1 mechanosensitive ion channel family protein [Sinanaerobacter chloroacetimidivorans]